jgi:hypothetical protein
VVETDVGVVVEVAGPPAVVVGAPGPMTTDACVLNPAGAAALPPLPSPMTMTTRPTTTPATPNVKRAISLRWVSAGAVRYCAHRRSSAPWRIGSST